MEYVLVDRDDNIVDKKDLSGDIGIDGARTFFVSRKQIPYENFIQLWKVMTKDEYDQRFEAHIRKPSSERTFRDYPGYIRWWEDETDNLDIEKP